VSTLFPISSNIYRGPLYGINSCNLMICILLHLIECICWLLWRTRSSVIIDADIVLFYFSKIKQKIKFSNTMYRKFILVTIRCLSEYHFTNIMVGTAIDTDLCIGSFGSLPLSLLHQTDFFTFRRIVTCGVYIRLF
jgi:hypothetical protein